MNTRLECIPCFVRQAAEAVSLCVEDPAQREALLRRLLLEVAQGDWTGSPPVMAQRLHRIIRRELGDSDPYRSIKERMNRAASEGLPVWRQAIARSSDPCEAVVRLAIGGNLLDSGAKTGLEPEDLARRMHTILEMPLVGDPHALFRAAEQASCILYVTDNAGEIMLDRLLIEALPSEKITVAVRGQAVINDATLKDAEWAGLPELAPVITSGSDVPGTVLEECSEEFQHWHERADLVIAKGQGNYETLSETVKPTYFLLSVKCALVARHVGAPVGSLVIARGGVWE